MAISIWRRLLAQGLLAAPGVWLLADGALSSRSSSEIFLGGLVTTGAVLIGRRGVVSQVLGRGAAWTVLGPCLVAAAVVLGLDHTLPDAGLLATIAAAAGALALTRPMLATDEAKAAFAPLAFRRSLLFASYAAVAYAIGLGTAVVDLVGRSWQELSWLGHWVGLPLLAGSLLASAVGVARMRAWGVLLGACASVLALVVGATARDGGLGTAIATAALPGAMMVGAIIAARWRASKAPRGAGARVRIASGPEPTTQRALLRIAVDDEAGIEEHEAPRAPARRSP